MDPDVCVMKWSIVRGVMLICSSAGVVRDEVFDPMLNAARELSIDGCLTISLGNTRMNSTQRTESAAVLKEKGHKAVVLTDSLVARGIMTAVSWFGGDIEGFPLSEMERALDALNLQADRRAAVRVEAARLRAEVEREQALKRAG